GTLSAGTLAVSGIASGGAVTAPYFTATSTTATSTFTNVDASGAFAARSTTNAIFGDGVTGGITLGDGSFTKTMGSEFDLDSGLVLHGGLTTQGINMNGYSITDAQDITLGRNQSVARIGVDDS